MMYDFGDFFKRVILIFIGFILLRVIEINFVDMANPYTKKYLEIDLKAPPTDDGDYDPLSSMYQILYLNELGKSSK